jgi:hypothetical protein
VKRPLVKCSSCAGTGRHELSPPFWTTYRKLTTEWQSTEAVLARHASLSVARTALIGRLNALVGHGLLERRRHESGRGLEWRRVP